MWQMPLKWNVTEAQASSRVHTINMPHNTVINKYTPNATHASNLSAEADAPRD